jgi:DNA invertase Pin-like site-specific DNA recombinase
MKREIGGLAYFTASVTTACSPTDRVPTTSRKPASYSTCLLPRLLVTMLAGIAEFERELIRARTGEGRTRAKARGVRFGRPPVLSVHQRQEVIQRLVEGVTQADLARSYGVSQATISRLQPLPFEHASLAGA